MPVARIVGTGSFVPQRVVTNAELERMVETNDEWIRSRTGIQERHRAAEGEATSDLATRAAIKALEMGGLDPADLDMILVATISPDMVFPATACVVQDHLGAKRAGALDIEAACSGFIYGLALADGLLRLGTIRTVLVIGAETLSRIVNWQDRNTCVLFGDGAGAVLLRAVEGERGVLSTHLHSDGSKGSILLIPAGGSRRPVTPADLETKQNTIHMASGNEVFKLAVRAMEEASLEALKRNGLEVKDLDLVITHQANLRIIAALGQRLGLPEEKIYHNIQRVGNTSAASIPLALDEAVRAGRVKEGDLLLFAAFGGGLTWGASLVRW